MVGASLIGLISDTHGLLRPEAIAALGGSDLIIHAGDVGASDSLDQLRSIAPVVAVRGNVDKKPVTPCRRKATLRMWNGWGALLISIK